MPPALGSRQTRLGCVALLLAALAVAGEEQTRSGAAANVGYYNYESPHSNPIAALPDGSPADTVDVVDAASGAVVARIHVGIDPVGIAVRPDGREVWVSNHVSDFGQRHRRRGRQPHAAPGAGDDSGLRRRHPVDALRRAGGHCLRQQYEGHVALSSSNRIAVVDVLSRRVVRHLDITAQDPRALAVRGGRLYVVPFESNNQTQISGCWRENLDGAMPPTCQASSRGV